MMIENDLQITPVIHLHAHTFPIVLKKHFLKLASMPSPRIVQWSPAVYRAAAKSH